MSGRERLVYMLGVWLAVYPSITLMSWLTGGLDWPLEAKTLLTTAITVPLITFVVAPLVRKIMAKAEDKPELAGD